jgi:hypothetical protein
MVIREKRDRALELVERFLSGEISSDDLADNYPRDKNDPAVGAIYERLWFFWDDRHKHKLTGRHQLAPEVRALFERSIMFLRSDLEYEWPPIQWDSLTQAFLRLLGLRKIADKRSDEWTKKLKSDGNLEVWPFIRDGDYAAYR